MPPRKATPKGKKTSNKRGKEDDGPSKETKKQKMLAPTVQEIIGDELTQLSLNYWAHGTEEGDQKKPFDATIIERIYEKELSKLKLNRLMLLEVSHYLENYLWKYFDVKTSTHAHLMSIIIMVNEKFRENVPAWECFHERESDFPAFFRRILDLVDESQMTRLEKTHYIVFLINCFQSLEDPMVRKESLRLVSLPLWHSLNPARLEKELASRKKLQKHWNILLQKEKKDKGSVDLHEREFLPKLMKEYLEVLYSITEEPANEEDIHYCERFVEFLLDLISQLPTRRFFHIVMRDHHVAIHSRLSPLISLPSGKLFSQLVEMLRFFDGFEVDDFTGKALSEEEMNERNSNAVRSLQRLVFKEFQDDFKNLAMSSIAGLEERKSLLLQLEGIPTPAIRALAVRLALLRPEPIQSDSPTFPKETRAFLEELFVSTFEKRMSQIDVINQMPLYPSEELLWDNNIIPSDEYTGEHCLALPKLNLQFLTFYDYLLRNYDLFRLESAYEIRHDLEDAISRTNPHKDPKGKTVFTGWSRMALPVDEFILTKIGKVPLGENCPSEVLGEINYSVASIKGSIRTQWDELKKHDVLFLISFKPPAFVGDDTDANLPLTERFGVTYVRGCEVLDLWDEAGNRMRTLEENNEQPKGHLRKLSVALDPAQYKLDMNSDEDVYGSFQLIVRRKPKENNFKAILQTLRDLMNSVPEWLHDVFLGYGDPRSANISDKSTFDFVDTFHSVNHLKESFPDREITFVGLDGQPIKDPSDETVHPPFKLTLGQEGSIEVRPYPKTALALATQEPERGNPIPFTPTQISAIHSALRMGLTLVVGPPGTGKTDVAVQIISNWYHNFPTQRTLIVTHSNQALNQIFEKICHLDIDERHLLRLGHGEELLETEKDFTKTGRVNYMLEKRIGLLKEVEVLGKSLGMGEDIAYTCETAEHFYRSHVVVLWEEFEEKCKIHHDEVEVIAKSFPFKKFFPGIDSFFGKKNFAEEMEVANSHFKYLADIFSQLRECRAFELLMSPYDRANYLLTKQAKIVAMTCTHAAIKRQELISLGFKYDNILMEEAGQILEIETFIPMLLQEQGVKEMKEARLQRVVLIGDHHQLPPIVKNIAFQQFAHFDQSLFSRFVRLGIPTIELDSQGRSRPSLADLFNWRYKQLKNLPITSSLDFQLANPGFSYEYQLIDVGDYAGAGETSPTAFFYQNLGEAEYIAAIYPAEKITILTTYNGQKELLKDVINSRCASHPLFGRPRKISTVDRYQGQQNDYILLSLVRTRAVGHIRDIRRLVVAMSRARMGLYVFCRKSLFANCYELTPTFSKFLQRPTKLQLVQGESFPTTRKTEDHGVPFQVEDVVHMGALVASMQEQLVQAKEAETKQMDDTQ